MIMGVINLQKVGFTYGEQWLFKDISVQITEGDFVAVIGPNGAGKSTLLRLIANIYPPTAGQVYLFGQPITAFKDWQKIGYVPQNPARQQKSFPITVREVIALGCLRANSLWSALTKTDKQAIDAVLTEFDLQTLAERRIGDLSGGQQQKVFLAKALVKKPQLLLLDEPATGIDSQTKVELYERLAILNKAGCTVVMISHDLELTARVASSALCVDRGVCFYGKAQAVLKHQNKKHTDYYQGQVQ